MKYLDEISPGAERRGPSRVLIKGLAHDSRLVEPGTAFFAIEGLTTDGHEYIDKAIESGAVAIFCQKWPKQLSDTIAYVKVGNSSVMMARVAHMFFDKPSNHLHLVGVTGTNGKTTIVSLLYQLYRLMGYKVGLLSTVECRINEEVFPSKYTTPDSVVINSLLREMVDLGCDYVFMEVSSHAVKQNRIEGLTFSGGIFTNMSHDHLDYHKTFDDYILHKKLFFDQLPESAFALTNIDDKRGEVMVQNTKARIARYSIEQMTDFKGKILANNLFGLELKFNQEEFFSQLIGRFNAYNLLAVYSTSFLLGAGPNIAKEMSMLHPAAGRMDRVNMAGKNAIAFVDYAHTPDALQNILETIKELKPPKGKMICVVGCGGNRDKAKRPKMAAIASRMCDLVIFTSDNPRDEHPDQIIKEMEAGVIKEHRNRVLSITDRFQAIKTGYSFTNSNDVLIIAGKGHEPYQEIEGVRHPFDDKKIILDLSNEDI